LANQLAGNEFVYAVKRGDTFVSIGSRYGVGPLVLAGANGLKISARLKPGQVLQIDNRHIVPHELDDGILINVPQRMLFLFRDGKLVSHYPVALGRPTWPTSTGGFHVLELREHPTWHVPKSIQREMAMQGKVVKHSVPPGPDNPLGDYWLGLNLDSYGIHATNRPGSIYGFRTHGCIRLSPADAKDLYDKVTIGTRGVIVYHPVLLARSDEGRIFLEVNKDQYHLGNNPLAAARALAESLHLDSQIDWNRAGEVADASEGIARDVSPP